MRYHLRFFLDNGKPHTEQYCFASADSDHLPDKGTYIYLGDELIDDKHNQKIGKGFIFKVVGRLFCFNKSENYNTDCLSSVEISVKKTKK